MRNILKTLIRPRGHNFTETLSKQAKVSVSIEMAATFIATLVYFYFFHFRPALGTDKAIEAEFANLP